jgi:hypothetical protein
MRVALLVALVGLTGCASEKLALVPPSGVNFSGRWKLDEADSDDPMRIVQSQMTNTGPAASGSSGGRRGQGGRGGGGGRGGAGGGYDAAGAGPPPLPAVGALSEALRWPGKELEIKQVAGVVAVTSSGDSRVFQPVADAHAHRHRKPDDDVGPRDRDMRTRGRDDGPPPICGWDGKTLVVQAGAPDDDHPPFEERYSLSEDGRRLIEVVGFKSSRSAGFTMSRVWERVQ